mgnify:CR=1 FL=1
MIEENQRLTQIIHNERGKVWFYRILFMVLVSLTLLLMFHVFVSVPTDFLLSCSASLYQCMGEGMAMTPYERQVYFYNLYHETLASDQGAN